MERLITASEFSTLKNISKKIDTSRIEQAIDFAQQIDLYDYLGDFLFDVVINKDEAPYSDLMNGSTFSSGSFQFMQAGLKALLADLAYVRYLMSSNINDTPFGLVQKDSTDSTPIDRNLIKDLGSQAMRDADVKFSLINTYLEENAAVFTRYSKGDNPNINTGRTRFEVLPQRNLGDYEY